jgi:hypothetical protein
MLPHLSRNESAFLQLPAASESRQSSRGGDGTSWGCEVTTPTKLLAQPSLREGGLLGAFCGCDGGDVDFARGKAWTEAAKLLAA